MMSLGNQPVRKSPLDLRFVVVAGIGFVVGVIVTMLISIWVQSGRSETIAELTEQVEQMQAQAGRASPAAELALPTLQTRIERDARVEHAIAVVEQRIAEIEVTEVSVPEPVVEIAQDPDTTAAEIDQLLQEVSAKAVAEVQEATELPRTEPSVEAQAALAALRRDAFSGSYVRAIPEPDTVTAPLLYTVAAGDSLATIALAFYGDTDEYLRLFEANRNVLDTPDQIEAGQQLVIPEVQ